MKQRLFTALCALLLTLLLAGSAEAQTANSQLTVANVTTSSFSTAATATGTLILSPQATIAGPVGITVASFRFTTVPAVGTLRAGSATGPVVTAGQVLSAAQAAQLYYTPAGSTTQNVSFTYSAIDSNGNTSANTATYTIPLVAAPTTPTACGPSYGGGAAASGLSADYYTGYFDDNLNFFGSTAAALTRVDPQVNFTSSSTTAAGGWGNIIPPAQVGANATDPDRFSVRQRGSINITTAGSYTFYLLSDDASFLWLDGAALAPTTANATIRNGGTHGTVTIEATVTLTAGWHNLLLYYGENVEDNLLTLEYSSTAGAGFGRRVVPTAVLCPGPSALPAVASSVATSAANAKHVTLSPNPVVAITRLDLSQLPAGAYQARVLDNLGRQVLTTTCAGGTATALDMRAVASGTYTVLVSGPNGQQYAKRLVKE